MTTERKAQMRDAFYKLLSDPSNSLDPESVWLACVCALEPMVRDGERYRFLFDQSVKTWSCDPLWPLVGFFRDGDETITKAIIDLAIDSALERKNATD